MDVEADAQILAQERRAVEGGIRKREGGVEAEERPELGVPFPVAAPGEPGILLQALGGDGLPVPVRDLIAEAGSQP